MSDSDERQNMSAEEIVATTRRMDPNVEDLLGGNQLLSGPAVVELAINVEEALTPQEAVSWVIGQIANYGFSAFTFAVTDKLSGEEYLVRAGQLLSRAEVQQAIDGDDDDGQPT